MKKWLMTFMLSAGVIAIAVSQTSASEDFSLFEVIPDTYVYSSGAGAWGNELTFSENGTFVGYYHDSEMGSTGEGYPKGSVYLCNYSGEVSEPRQIADTIYEMDVTTLELEELPETEEIVDQIRYIYSVPYGIANADTLTLYMPGTPHADLPETALHTVMLICNKKGNALAENQYIIYSEADDACFCAEESETATDTDAGVDLGTISIDESGTGVDVGTISLEEEEGCEYILPNVSSRYYSQKEIKKLTLQEINYAKNEIYAIHGRKFKSQELRDYFNSTSWYSGTIEGDSFDASVFNAYEQANLNLLVECEKSLAGEGGYALNQPGYNINAARQGFLDGENGQTKNNGADA